MVSASQPLGDLVSALRRAGWGPIAGPQFRACRAILDALASNSKWASLDRSGSCVITTPQLADHAGYSDRHIRRWLPVLEDIGLIEWQRGGVVDGKPRPGVLRVVKRVLAKWIRDARPSNDKRVATRNEATRARLSLLRFTRIRPFRRKPVVHADTASGLPPYRGRTGRPARPSDPKPSISQKDPTMSKLTNDIRLARTLPPEEYMPMVCGHGASDPRFCNECRYEGWLAKQDDEAAKAAATAAEREEHAAAAARAEQERANRWAEYMKKTYPGASRAQWARIVRDGEDATARELVGL